MTLQIHWGLEKWPVTPAFASGNRPFFPDPLPPPESLKSNSTCISCHPHDQAYLYDVSQRLIQLIRCTYFLYFQGYFFTRSFYYIFIQDWLRVFPRKQIYITRLEDYTKSRHKVLREMHTFLGLGKKFNLGKNLFSTFFWQAAN